MSRIGSKVTALFKLRRYINKRLSERSFWIGVGLATGSAALLPDPWNYVSFIVGTMAALVPDGKVDINA